MLLYLEEQLSQSDRGKLICKLYRQYLFFLFGTSDPKCEWPKHIKQNLKIEGV